MDDEVEILEPDSASKGIFACRNSNPKRWEGEALGEGLSSGRKSLNPCQGTDLVCTCDENEVIAYLRSAVERKDFAFVFRTLRGRELRFRTSEKTMEEEVKTLKRELVAVREAEGKKFSKLMEEYEGFKFKHRETEPQLEGMEIRKRETESQLEDLKIKQRETESELEGLKIKNRETESELEVLKIKQRETESELEGLKIKHRGTESELERLKKRFDNLSKDYREKIPEGLNCGSTKENKSTELEDNGVKEIVLGCETPARGHADTGVSTPLMEVSTPKCLEKSDEKEKECGRVKRTLKFDNEDDTEIQKREGDRIADISNLPAHASSLPISSVNNVVNKVLSPHCSVNIVSNGLNPGVSEVDGLGNNGIEENSLRRQSVPKAIVKSEDEIITSANLGASCHSSIEKPSIPARKIDMEGSVVVGTSLLNEVVIVSDSDSESSSPSLRKKRLSTCSKKATFTPKKQNIEADIRTKVKIGGVSDDGGKYSDQNEGQPLQRGAKRRCQMTVSSGSESNSSDVGFSSKRRKPRSGNSQIQGIREAECVKDTGASAGENVQRETSPKGPKEDAVLSDPHETYECKVLDRNIGAEDSLSCKEVEDVPDTKLKRIRKTKDVNELLTVGHCDEHTDEIQGEASPGARFRSLKRVIEGNELPDIGQLNEGICPVKRSPVTKYRRLKRGDGEADGIEKTNVGNVPEKNTLDLDVNDGTISNDNGECKFSIGGSSFTKRGKSDGTSKVTEGPSDSPIYTQNNRRLRSQSRKMINLTKESDGEDEDEDEDERDSEIDDIGDFIVDSSESEKDSECEDGNKSDSEISTNNLDTEGESNPSSGDDLHEVIRKLSRQKERKLDWKYEGEMLAAFAKDDVLCMRAVCALYRQQTNDEKRGKSSLYLNRRGFDKIHATRGSLLAEFLTDNDPSGPMNKSLQELQKHDSRGAEYCKKLASHHSKQLFEIYRNNEDPHFPHR